MERSSHSFFLSGVLRTLSTQDITQHFSKYGNNVVFQLEYDSNGKSLGYGWLSLDSDDAESLLTVRHEIKNAVLCIEPRKGDPRSVTEKCDVKSSPHLPVSHESLPSLENQLLRKRKKIEPNASTLRENKDNPSTSSKHCLKIPANVVEPNPSVSRRQNTIISTLPTSSKSSSLQYTAINTSSCTTSLKPDLFVCVQMQICPPHLLYDPRVICAHLDSQRLGTLQIVPKPTQVSVHNLSSSYHHSPTIPPKQSFPTNSLHA